MTLIERNAQVLIYSGSLDIIVGAPLTDAFLSKMEFEGSPAFHAAVHPHPSTLDPEAYTLYCKSVSTR